MNEKNSQNRAWVRLLGLFSVILVDLIGYPGAGFAMGYLLWKKVGFPWWFMVITGMTGLSLAMYRLYRMSNKDMS